MSRGAGILDRRIQLYRYTPEFDNRGGEIPVYALIGSVWAQYNPDYGKSNERLQGSEISANTWATFLIRFRTDIGTRDQIWFKPRQDASLRKFDIQSIDMIGERNEYLQILGLERQTS